MGPGGDNGAGGEAELPRRAMIGKPGEEAFGMARGIAADRACNRLAVDLKACGLAQEIDLAPIG